MIRSENDEIIQKLTDILPILVSKVSESITQKTEVNVDRTLNVVNTMLHQLPYIYIIQLLFISSLSNRQQNSVVHLLVTRLCTINESIKISPKV